MGFKEKRKKVIHIVHNLQIGGVETAVRSSVDTFNNEFDFYVISLHPNNVDFVANLTHKNKLKCFNLHSILFPINLIRLVLFVLKLNPDLIISSLWKSHGVTLLLKLFKPTLNIVVIIHSSAFFHWFDSFFTKQIVKKAVLVLCDSNSSKQFIEDINTTIKAEVVSYKINQGLAIKNIRVLSANKMNAVFIGRISQEKRIDRSIQLVYLLIKKGVDVSLDIYGPDNNKESDLRALIHDLGIEEQIKIHGSIAPDEVLSILDKYDFMLQLSDVEGMAITVVQAMQQGLIPIVTCTGEMKFYVKHQQNGLIVYPPFDDLDLIANQITEMIKLPSKMNEMCEAARATFINQPIYATHLQQILLTQIG